MAERNMRFSKRLGETLDLCGLTQKALAEKIGIRPQSMTRYCRHGVVPEWQILVPMARALEVTTDWLLAGEGQLRPEAPRLGEIIIQLSQHDLDKLTDKHTDLLCMALEIFLAEGEAQHYAVALESNLKAFSYGVDITRRLHEAGEGEPADGN